MRHQSATDRESGWIFEHDKTDITLGFHEGEARVRDRRGRRLQGVRVGGDGH